MFVVVWQFEIAEEKIAAFEAAYSPDGSWAQLFRTSPKYLGTELLRDAYIPGAYLTIEQVTTPGVMIAVTIILVTGLFPNILPA